MTRPWARWFAEGLILSGMPLAAVRRAAVMPLTLVRATRGSTGREPRKMTLCHWDEPRKSRRISSCGIGVVSRAEPGSAPCGLRHAGEGRGMRNDEEGRRSAVRLRTGRRRSPSPRWATCLCREAEDGAPSRSCGPTWDAPVPSVYGRGAGSGAPASRAGSGPDWAWMRDDRLRSGGRDRGALRLCQPVSSGNVNVPSSCERTFLPFH